jgi:hypothetical protein
MLNFFLQQNLYTAMLSFLALNFYYVYDKNMGSFSSKEKNPLRQLKFIGNRFDRK